MNFFGISGLFIGGMSFALAVVVFLHNRRQVLNRVWAFFALAVSMWGVGAYIISYTQIPASAFLWWRLTHIGIILIPVFFVHFVYIFLDIKKRLGVFIVYALGVFFLVANTTSYFIANVRYVFDSFYYDSPPGVLYAPFVSFFGVAVGYTVYLLLKHYHSVSTLKQNQTRYFLIAIAVGFIGGGTSFLPVFQVDVYPVLNFAVALYPAIMSYAIFKYGFFNIKVIATELLAVGISTILFVQIFFAQSHTDIVLRSALFVFIFGMSIFLVRSVSKEVEQREKIEKLSEEKSEFMSFASHQIKGPLTNFKSSTSMILQGDFGKVSPEIREVVVGLYHTADQAVPMVQGFLDASKLEQEGGMKYEMAEIDLKKIAEEVVKEEIHAAEIKKLSLTFSAPEGEVWMTKGDGLKLKQVIFNLVDNAIKYTPAGTVAVALAKKDGKLQLSVKDSGVGIPKEDMGKLFKKFGRAEGAAKVNVSSNGLGLYLAAEFVKAHNGRIWAESLGAGKGSTFLVELNAVKVQK